jgi:hypothetical protein
MKAPTPEPITKFCERCDTPEARGKWLGISRLTRIPDAGWPLRSECQKAVTAEENAAGVRIVADYRLAEQTATDNDVGLARLRTHDPERTAFEKERIREQIRTMDEKTFHSAQAKLAELREEAAKLTRPIFERLTVEYDKELNALALRREEELTAMRIHLFVHKEDHKGQQHKDYTIYSDPLVTAWQCRRECVRHRSLNIDQDNSIACVQWLCTDEEHTPFQWL